MEDPLGDEHQSVLFLFLFYFSLLLLSNSFLYRDPHLPAYSFGCARLATSESSWHFGVEPQGILVSLLLLPFTSLLVNVQEGRRRGSLKDKRLDLSLSLFLSFFLSFLIYRPRRFPLPLPSRTPLHSHYSSKLSRNWLTLFYLLTYLHCVVESSRSKKKENRAKPRFEGKFGGRLQSVLLLLKSSPILLCGYTIDPS